MKSTRKTTSKVVSTKAMDSPTDTGKVTIGGGGLGIVGPGLAPPLKDYKKPGAT
jgi:hypothetical protein